MILSKCKKLPEIERCALQSRHPYWNLQLIAVFPFFSPGQEKQWFNRAQLHPGFDLSSAISEAWKNITVPFYFSSESLVDN